MRRLLVMLVALLPACGLFADRPLPVTPSRAEPIALVVHPPPPDPVALTGGDRLALFDALAAEVRAVHQFAPSTWENLAPLTFESAIAPLRDVFASATTEADLMVALSRFGDSLHDPHGGFLAAPPVRAHLALPIVLAPEWAGTDVRMVVTESRARGVVPGDVVTSYAGTPAAQLLTRYADRSSANQWRGVALDVADWMTARAVHAASGDGAGLDGSVVTLGLKKQDGTEAFVNVAWARGGWHGASARSADTPEYDRLRCAPGLPERAYPTYELASHSTTYCLYTSKSARYAPFPIVRFFSFDFRTAFVAEAEYDHLSRAVRALGSVRGVVLDLRDNAGGRHERRSSDPSWVLDWFAPKAYLDLRTQVKKTPRIDRLVLEDVAVLDEGWVDALVHAEDGALVSRFLGCRGADCSDTRRVPQHRIVQAKTALLVGPRCDSACDHFARVWDENGLGPIVGEPTGASLSVLRLDYPIVTRTGRRLGAMRLAISLDYSPFTGQPVEGRPLHVDVPVAWSWETRERYDAEMVDAAVGAIGK